MFRAVAYHVVSINSDSKNSIDSYRIFKSPIYEEIYGLTVGIEPGELDQVPDVKAARRAFHKGTYTPPNMYTLLPRFPALRHDHILVKDVIPWSLNPKLFMDPTKIPSEPNVVKVEGSDTLVALNLSRIMAPPLNQPQAANQASISTSQHKEEKSRTDRKNAANSNRKQMKSPLKVREVPLPKLKEGEVDPIKAAIERGDFVLNVPCAHLPTAELFREYNRTPTSDKSKWRRDHGMVLVDGILTYKNDVEKLLAFESNRQSGIEKLTKTIEDTTLEDRRKPENSNSSDHNACDSDSDSDSDRPFLSELMKQYLAIVHGADDRTLSKLGRLTREKDSALWKELERSGVKGKAFIFFKKWINGTFDDFDEYGD